jgi:4-hydroxy-3-polyprenylbenzoate decarboxylase
LVLSDWARKTIEIETEYKASYVEGLADYSHNLNNLGACISSGSFPCHGMIVAPCSIKTLSAIANSFSSNLLIRAADVTLKERRKLLLMVRETPLHLGHLRLMTAATECGATIFPPVPAFYNKPQSTDAVVTNTVSRILDTMGLENNLSKRWGGG